MKANYWERGRFLVENDTRTQTYLVDLLEEPDGWCDCPDYQIRILPHLGTREPPPRTYCKHIRECVLVLADAVRDQIPEARRWPLRLQNCWWIAKAILHNFAQFELYCRQHPNRYGTTRTLAATPRPETVSHQGPAKTPKPYFLKTAA